jgi:predicted nucleotidyltransferase
MNQCNIVIPNARIAQFCQANSIRKLALFGSVLRDDFHAESDVDVLVEFEAGSRITSFDKARMRRELSSLIGRKVDLRTPAELSPYFRDPVLAAEAQYVRR